MAASVAVLRSGAVAGSLRRLWPRHGAVGTLRAGNRFFSMQARLAGCPAAHWILGILGLFCVGIFLFILQILSDTVVWGPALEILPKVIFDSRLPPS